MNKFIAKQSIILSDYESHKSLSFQFYESGVSVDSRQDEVNNKDGGAEPRHFSSLIVSHLKNDEAIKLRDRLLTRYPIEQIVTHKAEPSDLKVSLLRIRGVHPYSFRSGEWATVVGVAKCSDNRFPEGRQCYKVRFDDGVIDYWLISEISKSYETKYEVDK